MAYGMRDRNRYQSRLVGTSSSNSAFRRNKQDLMCTFHGDVKHINTPFCNWQPRPLEAVAK